MSLHDMYFSLKNKDHMYNILSQIILDKTGNQIKNNELFIEASSFSVRTNQDALNERGKARYF